MKVSSCLRHFLMALSIGWSQVRMPPSALLFLVFYYSNFSDLDSTPLTFFFTHSCALISVICVPSYDKRTRSINDQNCFKISSFTVPFDSFSNERATCYLNLLDKPVKLSYSLILWIFLIFYEMHYLNP